MTEVKLTRRSLLEWLREYTQDGDQMTVLWLANGNVALVNERNAMTFFAQPVNWICPIAGCDAVVQTAGQLCANHGLASGSEA